MIILFPSKKITENNGILLKTLLAQYLVETEVCDTSEIEGIVKATAGFNEAPIILDRFKKHSKRRKFLWSLDNDTQKFLSMNKLKRSWGFNALQTIEYFFGSMDLSDEAFHARLNYFKKYYFNRKKYDKLFKFQKIWLAIRLAKFIKRFIVKLYYSNTPVEEQEIA